MRALRDCLPWSRPPGDPTDPAPVAPSPRTTPRASAEIEREPLVGSEPAPQLSPAPSASREPLEVQGLPAPAAPRTPRPRPAAPTVAPLPRGARAPRCSRSTHGTERRIETEHYRYHAVRPAAGRLWSVAAFPTSAAARYYIDARGEPIAFTCPLASLPSFIAQTERELEGYWGDTLDTRRDWP